MPAAAIIGLAPYILEALNLAGQYVAVLSKVDEASEADMEELASAFKASQDRRDTALDGLKAAIEAKRAEG